MIIQELHFIRTMSIHKWSSWVIFIILNTLLEVLQEATLLIAFAYSQTYNSVQWIPQSLELHRSLKCQILKVFLDFSLVKIKIIFHF